MLVYGLLILCSPSNTPQICTSAHLRRRDRASPPDIYLRTPILSWRKAPTFLSNAGLRLDSLAQLNFSIPAPTVWLVTTSSAHLSRNTQHTGTCSTLANLGMVRAAKTRWVSSSEHPTSPNKPTKLMTWVYADNTRKSYMPHGHSAGLQLLFSCHNGSVSDTCYEFLGNL